MVDETQPISIRSPEEYPLDHLEEQFYRYIQFILEEKAIPQEIKELFWAFSDQENALTNLTDSDIRNIINHLEIAFSYITMNKPDYNFNFADEIMLAQLRAKLMIKLKRSKLGFERKMQATQIREVYAQQKEAPITFGKKIGGFFAKLVGR